MVRIPYIKIPSVRVGSIGFTSNIGAGGATPAPPTPITYLTQWKIVGNSEVHGQEIWSCGEYNATDGKYHILVQPLGGSIADIALDEPLRKVNNVADTIEFADGVATVTTNIGSVDLGTINFNYDSRYDRLFKQISDIKQISTPRTFGNMLIPLPYELLADREATKDKSYYLYNPNSLYIHDSDITSEHQGGIIPEYDGIYLIYELETPITELVDAPQIEEADSYTCVISQGAKAVEWSSFETKSE